jgi:hypothetical protein
MPERAGWWALVGLVCATWVIVGLVLWLAWWWR